MRILVTCHAAKSPFKQASGGFTLLEMLVVLLLGGLVTALVMPGLSGMVGSLQRSIERAGVNEAVLSLPHSIRQYGQPVVLKSLPSDKASPAFDELQAALSKAGARLVSSDGIFFSAAGFCPFGGPVALIDERIERRGIMLPPDCRIQWHISGDDRADS